MGFQTPRDPGPSVHLEPGNERLQRRRQEAEGPNDWRSVSGTGARNQRQLRSRAVGVL